jgi:ankyrin repeat protein
MLRRNLIGAIGLGLAGAICTTFMFFGSVTDTRVADAAMHGDKGTVRDLLKQAVDVNAAQGDGMTALHWAALNGDAELAQTLLRGLAATLLCSWPAKRETPPSSMCCSKPAQILKLQQSTA